MEYLISKGFRQVSQQSVDRLRGSCTFWSAVNPFVEQQDDFFVFSNAMPQACEASGNAYFLFDGQVFSGSEFLHPFLEPTPAQLQRLHANLLAKNWEKASGIFTLLKVDAQARKFTVHTDPLSQYPVLSWQEGNRYIVSNNALLIEAFLFERGFRLQRNPESLLFGAMARANLIGAGPFRGVDYAPARVMLTCGETVEFHQTLSATDLSLAPGTYDEHIEQCALGMKQRCDALIESRPDHYFLTDITGASTAVWCWLHYWLLGTKTELRPGVIQSTRSQTRMLPITYCTAFN